MKLEWSVLGSSSIVVTGGRYDLWQGNSAGTQTDIDHPNPAGESIAVKSSSANDTAAGANARGIRLTCLNTSDEIITQNVSTNGGTISAAAATSVKFVYDAEIITFGATKRSSGTITIKDAADGLGFGSIPIGWNRMASGRFLVPAGYTAQVQRIRFDTGHEQQFRGYLMANVLPATMVLSAAVTEKYEHFAVAFRRNVDVEFPVYGVFPEGAMLQLAAETDSGSATRVTGSMDILLTQAHTPTE